MQAPSKHPDANLSSRVRRARQRAAASYDAHAALFDEVGSRLLEHLDYIKLQPPRVLDLGCATGRTSAALSERYPQAHIVSIDPAIGMLRAAVHCNTERRHTPLCADLEALPLAARSCELIVCNLGAYWCRIDQLLPELLRVAAPGGLMLLSTFGPDTLQELRSAFRGVDTQQHVASFIDMHDIGDALGHSGFAEPIMQMDKLTLTYANLRQLTEELAALGMRNLLAGRAPGLYAKGKWCAASERYRLDPSGAVPATFEIVYATAWKPQQAQRTADGYQVVSFQPRRKS